MPQSTVREAYAVLGLPSEAGDAEVRAAFRRLVQLHHPDHNQGSAESARRFAAVQAAYLQVMEHRRGAAAAAVAAGPDAELEARLVALERELHEARQRAARRPPSPPPRRPRRPSPEELGYITTDDSLSKIVDDAEKSLARRLTDLFGGFGSGDG